MEIRLAKEISAQHYQLLLEADPSKKMVEEYLDRGFCYEARDNYQVMGVLVLLPTRPATIEIVNLSVAKSYQNQGYATQLIEFAKEFARDASYQTIEVGTGSTGVAQLHLYQKCGFKMTWIDREYFPRHYQEPIIENGLVLEDMVRFSQDL